MIRILLADDHPIVREGLRAVLETQPDFEVIGTPQQAADGEEALRLSLELQPDILLLDLEMPVIDGVETIRRLRQRVRQQSAQGRQKTAPRIIVFTAFDNDERIISALEAGADGYLLKGAPREDIFNAIRVTMQGGSLLQPVVASKLLRHMGQHRGAGNFNRTPGAIQSGTGDHSRESMDRARGRPYEDIPFEALTERELEVLALLAQGMPNKEIAVRLTISERTAKFHVSSIMGKLGATNRTEAVSLAAQRGLIRLSS
ncbi:MAG TPA: response regulator transcription factor [Ktedonobacteraceae bacterium]|jgi:DNA-binding NarL/FixJ family response regulator|nr:response regulator transcription factor [Ktedonobacteraceae bacterium]